MKNLPPAIRKKLLHLLRGRPDATAEVDELFSILLQLSLAVMLVFMIAFFLYQTHTGSALQEVDVLRTALNDAQMDRLTSALEQTREFYRERYGLSKFQVIAPDGQVAYAADTLIVAGNLGDQPLLRRAFVEGGRAAFSDYADGGALREAWRQRTLRQADLRQEELSPANLIFLQEELDRRLTELRNAVNEVQMQAAAAIQLELVRRPETVQNPRIQSLLAQINQADAALRRPLLAELTVVLKQYAFDLLRQQADIPLLEELK